MAALGLAVTLLVALFFPNNDELASRTARVLEDALGVPISIGALNWQLLPQPRVELLDVAISQPTAPDTADDADAAPGKIGSGAAADSGAAVRRTAGPLALQRVTLLPALSLASLWQHTVHFRRVEVDGASVPQRTLARLKLPTHMRQVTIFGIMLAAVPVETRVWRDVSWKPLHGPSAQLYGEADFDPQGCPRTAAVRLLQATSTTDMTLSRTGTTGNNPRWAVKSRVGGGTVDGEVELAETGNNLLLSGKPTPANVEVASVMEAFNRRLVI